MKKILSLTALLLFSLVISSCNKNDIDKVENVVITIHPETAFDRNFMSNTWSDYLVYSDNKDKGRHIKNQIIFENFDIEYERGYEYKFKAKKIKMSNPPMDVSNIKYVIQKLISKTKIITEQTEEIIEINLKPQLVAYTPNFPISYGDNGTPKQIDAMLASQSDKNGYIVIASIDGFEYEEGYGYVLEVKKTTHPKPYFVRYELIEVKSKTEAIEK